MIGDEAVLPHDLLHFSIPRAQGVSVASTWYKAARENQGLRQRLQGMGQDISSVRTPDQFEAFVRQEENKYRRLIIEAKIVAE